MTGAESAIAKINVPTQGDVSTIHGYQPGYSPKPLTEQLNRLRFALSSNIGVPNQDLLARIVKREIELPNGAEGWFEIPNIYGNDHVLSQFGGSIPAATQIVLDAIEFSRLGKFRNRESRLDSLHLRQFKNTEESFRALSEAQGNPAVLIVPAQLGMRHQGKSVSRVREEYLADEFGLGAFAAGITLLIHPMRLWRPTDLWMDCPGDEVLSDTTGEFLNAPYFHFNDSEELEFASGEINDGSCPRYGAATGFVFE